MTLTIACDDPLAKPWVEGLLRLPWPCGTAPCAMTLRQVGELHVLLGADAQALARGSLGTVLEVAARRIGEHAVGGATEGLALHAGCVAHPDGAWLIAGASGAGKTTLTAWLVREGLRYLSDELALVSAGADAVRGWGRPLHVKSGSLAQVLGWAQPCAPLHYPHGAFVPAEALGEPAHACGIAPRVLLFVQHDAQADAPSLQPLSRAQAAQRLWGVTANTALLPDRGFAHVMALGRRVQAWVLHYAHVEQLGPLFAATPQLGWPARVSTHPS